MTDLTPILNELLKSYEAPLAGKTLTVQHIDHFLEEAYKIVSPESPTNDLG